jgi:hypothetical protein
MLNYQRVAKNSKKCGKKNPLSWFSGDLHLWICWIQWVVSHCLESYFWWLRLCACELTWPLSRGGYTPFSDPTLNQMITTCDRKKDFPRQFAAGIRRRPRVAWCGPVHKRIIGIYIVGFQTTAKHWLKIWDLQIWKICCTIHAKQTRQRISRWTCGPQFRCSRRSRDPRKGDSGSTG